MKLKLLLSGNSGRQMLASSSKKFYFFVFFSALFFQSYAQETKKIELIHADYLEYDEAISGKYRRLIGNVQFKHESAIMNCDSAYLFSETNYLEAYSRVHILQGDSLHLYADLLKYYGDLQKAELYGKIKLIDDSLVLTTTRLDYNLKDDIGFYTVGGRITDKENVLTSKIGNYYAKKNDFYFKENVVLTNPDYIILSDTLQYNSSSHIATFLSPSTITGKTDFIFCNHGWYDTDKEVSNFSKGAELCSNEYELKGDSIIHDSKSGISIVFGNMTMVDTLQKMIISGDYGKHNSKSDSSFVTGNAMLTLLMDNDSLFLHADTLWFIPDSISRASVNGNEKSADSDSLKKILLAYHHVKIFKTDLQGKCDSLTYSFRDSIMHFFREPVMWSAENQLTAQKMSMQMANGKMDKLYLLNSAFIVAQQDSSRFNQIKGKDMTGFFSENELKRIFVEGNGQTIYYARDKEEKFMGVNRAESSTITIYMEESKVQRINLTTSPEATFYPMNELTPKELLLKDFLWRDSERPEEKADIFIR